VHGTVEVHRATTGFGFTPVVAATVATAADGSFRLALPPGKYHLRGSAAGIGVPCEDDVSEPIVVVARQATTAFVTCHLK
jgi:hypothetical protein